MWWTRSSIPPSALGLVSGSRAGWERRPPPPRRRQGHRGIFPYVQGTTSGAGHVACARIALRVQQSVRSPRYRSLLLIDRARERRGAASHARRDRTLTNNSLNSQRSVLTPDRTVTSLLVSSPSLSAARLWGHRTLRGQLFISFSTYIYLNSTFYAASAASYPINTIRLPLHSVETLWSPFNNPFRPCARDRLQLGRRARSQARRARWPRT